MLVRREYLRSSNTHTFTEAEAKHCLQNKTEQKKTKKKGGAYFFHSASHTAAGTVVLQKPKETNMKSRAIAFLPLNFCLVLPPGGSTGQAFVDFTEEYFYNAALKYSALLREIFSPLPHIQPI